METKGRNTTKCGKVMDRFLMLDKHELLPVKVTLHLLKCRKCRTQIRYLSKAEKISSRPLKIAVPVTDAAVEKILGGVNPEWKKENLKMKPVSMKKWIFCGILMTLLMTTYSLSSVVLGNEKEFADTIFFILFGFIVTAYCAIFIASNLDLFIKKIEKNQPAVQPAAKA